MDADLARPLFDAPPVAEGLDERQNFGHVLARWIMGPDRLVFPGVPTPALWPGWVNAIDSQHIHEAGAPAKMKIHHLGAIVIDGEW
ncbi:MAG: hypothetical protein M1380_03295, partial [Chloroflexi bacterium]|nr:hypothetical protein [Chloroflexota bacterium]